MALSCPDGCFDRPYGRGNEPWPVIEWGYLRQVLHGVRRRVRGGSDDQWGLGYVNRARGTVLRLQRRRELLGGVR